MGGATARGRSRRVPARRLVHAGIDGLTSDDVVGGGEATDAGPVGPPGIRSTRPAQEMDSKWRLPALPTICRRQWDGDLICWWWAVMPIARSSI